MKSISLDFLNLFHISFGKVGSFTRHNKENVWVLVDKDHSFTRHNKENIWVLVDKDHKAILKLS